jgi:hypothetical protein
VTGVTVVGVRGHLVAVEARVGRGLPSLTLTGLYLDDPLDGFRLSAEDSAALHALMGISTVDVNRSGLSSSAELVSLWCQQRTLPHVD